MPVAVNVTDKKGLKRICMSCGARFYDFNKRPITCPSCETEFTGDMKVKSRRSRTTASADEYEGKVGKSQVEAQDEREMDDDEAVEGDETVSLEEVEEMDEGDDTPEDEVDADLELDEEDLEDEDLDEEEEEVEEE